MSLRITFAVATHQEGLGIRERRGKAKGRKTGNILLIGPDGARSEELDVKLDAAQHQLKGQNVLRVLIPWSGTSWNQHARVEARVKVGGPQPLMAEASIRLDEPDDGGFFKDIQYGEIDPRAPSQFAAGVITVNVNDQSSPRCRVERL